MLFLTGCSRESATTSDRIIGPDEGYVSEDIRYSEDVREITVSNHLYIEDAPLDPTHPINNFGAHDGGRAAYEHDRRCDAFLIRLRQLNALIPRKSKVLSCSMYLYVQSGDAVTGDKRVGVFKVFKPWVEGDGVWQYVPPPGEGCTFNAWDGWRAWGLRGCQNESSNGYPNLGDGSGPDCGTQPMTVTTIPGSSSYPYVVPGYYKFDLDPRMIEQWVETKHNEGIVLRTLDPSSWVHLGTKEAPVGQRPYFVIVYAPPQEMIPQANAE